MFFDTPWSQLSDSQRQGTTKSTCTNSLRLTANEYFTIGPTRIGGHVSVKKRYLSLYHRERTESEKRDLDTYTYNTVKFIKIDGKEIF